MITDNHSAYQRGIEDFAYKLRRLGDNPYQQFQHRYWHAPDAFMAECVNWPEHQYPTEYQLYAASALANEKMLAIRGPRRAGKSAWSALLVHWFALTRDGLTDWKIAITAGVGRQVTQYFFPEIHKWAHLLKWDVIGRQPYNTREELLAHNLKLATGSAYGFVSRDEALVEGAHASQLLLIGDEAKSIPDAILNALDPMFAGSGAEGIDAYGALISTPGPRRGRFYDIHRRLPGLEMWHPIKWTAEDAIAAQRITQEWVDSKRRLWGEDHPLFKQYVEAEFEDMGEEGVIPLRSVEAAISRWRLWNEQDRPGNIIRIGVDIGKQPGKTVIALYTDTNAVHPLIYVHKIDMMDIVAAVMEYMRKWPKAVAVIDVGYAPGIADRVQEQVGQERVIAFGAAEKSSMQDMTGTYGFTMRRDAMWWEGRELLSADDGIDIALPPDDRLIGDLTAPQYKVQSGMRVKVESKADIARRTGAELDAGDAVLMAICERATLKPRWRMV